MKKEHNTATSQGKSLQKGYLSHPLYHLYKGDQGPETQTSHLLIRHSTSPSLVHPPTYVKTGVFVVLWLTALLWQNTFALFFSGGKFFLQATTPRVLNNVHILSELVTCTVNIPEQLNQ